jgi:hypothetical protein
MTTVTLPPGLTRVLWEYSAETAPHDLDAIAVAIDAEIRNLRRDDEERIMAYTMAMKPWAVQFRALGLEHMSLSEAHDACCVAAQDILPYKVLPT